MAFYLWPKGGLLHSLNVPRLHDQGSRGRWQTKWQRRCAET